MYLCVIYVYEQQMKAANISHPLQNLMVQIPELKEFETFQTSELAK